MKKENIDEKIASLQKRYKEEQGFRNLVDNIAVGLVERQYNLKTIIDAAELANEDVSRRFDLLKQAYDKLDYDPDPMFGFNKRELIELKDIMIDGWKIIQVEVLFQIDVSALSKCKDRGEYLEGLIEKMRKWEGVLTEKIGVNKGNKDKIKEE